jgi:hypothetical protein
MVYVAWSTAFIVRSSFVSVFGKWVFCLFDDSMISMRFAHNFSRGLGLVWNPGEHVEGYTNFLYTIIMAVPQLFLNASRSCLFMQVLGIVWVLFAAFLASRIIGAVTDGRSLPLMRLAAFIATLSLYPLSYWPLMGMETGLLTVLVLLSIVIALRGRKDPSLSKALLLGATLSLAYLTRPDSFLYACAIGVYLFSLRRSSKEVLYRKKTAVFCAVVLVMLAITIGLMAGFRWLYYHALTPNTCTLKLGDFSLLYRLRGGIGYITPFIVCFAPFMFFAVIGVLQNCSRERVLLICCCGISMAYQVYTGGDPWPYWRIMTPTLPLLLVLALDTLKRVSLEVIGPQLRLMSSGDRGAKAATFFAAAAMAAGCMFAADYPFVNETLMLVRPFNRDANIDNVAVAQLLDTVLTKDASVGVFYAGSIPYYTNRYAIDFLGKCDPVIASLKPDLSGAVAWDGMLSVPGHNKYRLAYSIVNKQPTFIQGVSWGKDDVSAWAGEQYVKVRLLGNRMLLKKGSPQVKWDRITELGGTIAGP